MAFSTSSTNDTLHVYISVQKHQSISYDIFDVELKEKGTEAIHNCQISSKYPYGVINDLTVYHYYIPYQINPGALYEVSLDNKRLCNIGPFKIEEVFSSDNIRTFSYANPGFQSTHSVKVYNRQ